MPYLYTHQLIAEKVKTLLPERILQNIRNDYEYFVGAQGGDVFYLYKLKEGAKNLGRYLHRANVYKTFSSFLQTAREENESKTLSYVAGYITHYAADVTFHPYIYNLLKKYKNQPDGFKGNRHALIESDIDSFFVQNRSGIALSEYKYPLECSNADLLPIFHLIDKAIDKKTRKNLNYSSFKRAVKRFFRYSAWSKDSNGIKRKLIYGTEKILHIPHTLSALIRRNNYDEKYFNLKKEYWVSPYDTALVCCDDINNLFDRAVSESARLITRFFECKENGDELDKRDFGKRFSGEEER